MDADALVADYLARLRTAAAGLPAGRPDELVAELGEHIEAALAESGVRDELTVRTILDRLGTPDAIVAAESLSPDASAPPPVVPAAWPQPTLTAPDRPRTWGPVEVIAVLLLSVGSVLMPVIGPLIGILLAWVSSRWTSREKGVATLLYAGTVLIVFAPRFIL
jgi:hypothetical protein